MIPSTTAIEITAMKNDSINLFYYWESLSEWCRDGRARNRVSGTQVLDAFAGSEASIGIDVQYLFYRFGKARRRFIQNRFYCSWYLLETDTAFEERCYRHFVGRVQGNRLRAPCFDGLIGQT